MIKVAVAMSGGVDSSVTAALLQQQGYDVIGLTMVLFPPRHTGPGSAMYDGAAVAAHLGISHHIADFSEDFRQLIIDDFVDEYRAGHTPNPCVRCNRHIKFGKLLDAARELGADTLATGHYVRKTTDPDGTCHLRTATYLRKDQSYFLSTINRHQLSQLHFPLGTIESKDEVRRLARHFGLPVADKGDSQEVCFIPDDDYVTFLEQEGVSASSGEIRHLNGQLLGRHCGSHRYTVGQRKGLGIAWHEPLYVIGIASESNAVIVGEQQHLATTGLSATDLNWLSPPQSDNFSTTCKIRFRHQPVSCQVLLTENNSCEVRFNLPQRAVTPGQTVVFYGGDEVLGGGRIVSPLG